MIFTIVGLAVATAVSLIGAATSNITRFWRAVLAILALTGFGISIYSAIQANADKKAAERNEREARQEAANAKKQLQDLQTTLNLVRATVGDLGKLDELSGGVKYYVRVAADTNEKNLEPFLKNIEADIKGAKNSDIVCIREPKHGSKKFELIFGAGLDLAAAEVFHRLATSHHFPPPREIAWIQPETGAKCFRAVANNSLQPTSLPAASPPQHSRR